MTESTLDLQQHLDAATAEGGSLASYARRHGLNPAQLYNVRHLQKTKASRPEKLAMPKPAFTRIKSAPVSSLVRVQLANGVVIEVGSDALIELLPALKAL